VKVLKISIAVMGFLIVAALLAIVGRVMYLSTVSKPASTALSAPNVALAPEHTMVLPSGAAVKHVSLQENRLLVHYETEAGAAAAILDLATGKTLSHVAITTSRP